MKRVVVAKLSDISERRSRIVHVGNLEIALFKLTNGDIRAIENKCPHKGGKLSEGIVCDQHVHCPLHDWKINLTDGQVQSPDEGCVVTFRTEVDIFSREIAIYIDEADIMVS